MRSKRLVVLLILILLASCVTDRGKTSLTLPPSLLDFTTTPSLGLPEAVLPGDASLNFAAVELGRRMFHDERLSEKRAVACSSCHVPEQAFSKNDSSTPPGSEIPRRNTASLLNVVFYDRLFADGREDKLEHQLWTHILDGFPMGHVSVGLFVQRVNSIDDYGRAFRVTFGRGPDADSIAYAMASFQRTLIAGNSPFDRWYFGNQQTAVDDDVKRGFELFRGKAKCTVCHSVSKDTALFTDQKFHNTGVGYRASLKGPFYEAMTIEPGVEVQVAPAFGANHRFQDTGRFEVTAAPGDQWKYRTPNLRNVALTAPYMHNGSIASLPEVVEFYDKGGVISKLTDPEIRPLGLTAVEKQDIVTFLESLTSDDLPKLIRLSLEDKSDGF